MEEAKKLSSYCLSSSKRECAVGRVKEKRKTFHHKNVNYSFEGRSWTASYERKWGWLLMLNSKETSGTASSYLLFNPFSLPWTGVQSSEFQKVLTSQSRLSLSTSSVMFLFWIHHDSDIIISTQHNTARVDSKGKITFHNVSSSLRTLWAALTFHSSQFHSRLFTSSSLLPSRRCVKCLKGYRKTRRQKPTQIELNFQQDLLFTRDDFAIKNYFAARGKQGERKMIFCLSFRFWFRVEMRAWRVKKSSKEARIYLLFANCINNQLPRK